MAVRLHLKYGLVAEGDRLESSPDTILVTEPTVGTVLRSKGSLYTVVTARARAGGRPHEATALVAETIRREYYYDESAGIPACLDKAIRSANRRLRHQRDGQGLSRGALGAVVAIVRGHELYVATIGEGEAYLVRQARLLTLPEEERGEGLPTPDDPHVDVWRGDLEVGDSLLLVSRNLVRVVGTEELKNAVVTLHPQSAVEHLHHLFVAAGGDGSDAVLAVEATEAPASRSERRATTLARPRPEDADDDEPVASRLPPQAAAAVASLGAAADTARDAVASAFWSVWDRLTDFVPRRRSRYRRVASLGNRREAQRRAAFAVLGMVGVVTVVGLSAWLIGGALANTQGSPRATNETSADRAIEYARDRLDEVNEGNLITENEERATQLLREAYAELGRAAEPGTDPDVDVVRREVAAGLDVIYRTRVGATGGVYPFEALIPESVPVDLEPGPDGAAYTFDSVTGGVIRVDTEFRRGKVVVTPGEGTAENMAEPWMLTVGGPDLLILDRAGALWRWRPDGEGDGALREVRVVDNNWGDDVIDIGTYIRSASSGAYNLYVVDPSVGQVMRHEPAADGTGFPRDASGWLSGDADLSDVIAMAIDGDIYLLTPDTLMRYESGRRDTDFELEDPPDGGDLREGHEWGRIAITGGPKAGRIYVWDAMHDRVVEYLKSTGEYVQQFVGPNAERAFEDVTGMYVVTPDEGDPLLYWMRDQSMWVTTLAPPPGSAAPSASASPAASPAASP